MPDIYVENLERRFGQQTAVDGITLRIMDRELIIFLGPSGCGKTTTLNCIAGLDTPTRGKVYFDDLDVTNYSPHKRSIAMVFQSSLLYPHLNAEANIRMSLKKAKLAKAEVVRRIEHACAILQIKDVLAKKPFDMSGGERQRVAIAKALVRNPAAFLLDEPLANLDAALRETLRAEIVAMQKNLGVTMVLVTHDQVEAMTMGDRICVMLNGRIQQVGTPLNLYNEPDNRFVAGFVGSPPMNFFQGLIEEREEAFWFRSGSLELAFPSEMQEALPMELCGRDLMIGVRPQHLRLSLKKNVNGFSGAVYAVEQLGKETIVGIVYENNQYRAITAPESGIKIGDHVYVHPCLSACHLFERDSGKRISLKLP